MVRRMKGPLDEQSGYEWSWYEWSGMNRPGMNGPLDGWSGYEWSGYRIDDAWSPIP